MAGTRQKNKTVHVCSFPVRDAITCSALILNHALWFITRLPLPSPPSASRCRSQLGHRNYGNQRQSQSGFALSWQGCCSSSQSWQLPFEILTVTLCLGPFLHFGVWQPPGCSWCTGASTAQGCSTGGKMKGRDLGKGYYTNSYHLQLHTGPSQKVSFHLSLNHDVQALVAAFTQHPCL